MSESEITAEEVEPQGEVTEESVYSKDYWDNVFEQVGRRPLVKIALAVLALLYATAIYSPLIANDRPFFLEGIDYKEYADHNRFQAADARGVFELIENGREAYDAGLSEGAAGRTWAGALEIEFGSFENRVRGMAKYLPEGEAAPLEAVRERLGEAVRLAIGGDRESALSIAQEASAEARSLRDTFRASREGTPGKTLRPTTTWPILSSTTWVEVFFMWLWALVLTWPIWNRLWNRARLGGDRERIRKARRKKLGFVLGTSALAALLWGTIVGGSMAFHGSEYKSRITSGDIELTSATFPLITMGMSESQEAERFRPPTWTEGSELTDEGHYASGPRAPVPDQFGLLPPAQPVAVLYSEPALNASSRHILGTDLSGRDLFVRILHGGRISLMVGIVSTVLLVFIGVVMGALAGYFGGIVDILISRLIEIFQSIPAFFIILTAVAIIPEDKMPPIFAIVVVIALVRWTGVARLVRAEFLRLREAEFVVAAEALGFSNLRVIFRHVLPNAMGPVLVAAAFSIAAGILTESAVSFLGFGVKVPIPSWGSLLSEARGVSEYWWLQIFPGLLIFITVFSYNIVGEGVRDALDPRRKV